MKYLVALIILVLIGVGLFIGYKKIITSSPIETPIASLNPSPTTTANNNCTQDQLKQELTSEGAAGSIYGTLKITNISSTDCNVTLGNYITAEFSANNISTNYKDTGAVNQNFNLTPSSSVYSQVHFPNGPQCSGEIKMADVTFNYQTQDISLKFTGVKVQACQDESENTTIDIWPVSSSPISQ